jgi:hypothetical protein
LIAPPETASGGTLALVREGGTMIHLAKFRAGRLRLGARASF